MLTRVRKLIHDEQGNALVVVTFAMAGFLALAAVVLDTGILYVNQIRLQKIATAAVLSGAQQLTMQDDNFVMEVVDQILQAHQPSNHPQATQVDTIIEQEHKLTVLLSEDIPVNFSKIVGRDADRIKAIAAAELFPIGRTTGVIPLGLEEAFSFEFHTEYTLRIDSTGMTSEDFGLVLLGGLANYIDEDTLKDGFKEEVKVGDVMSTLNPIPMDVERLIQSNLQDQRTILLPVYQPYAYGERGLEKIQITGFAYFHITQPMEDDEMSIHGMFIKKVGKGMADANAVNKGAYSIKLTK